MNFQNELKKFDLQEVFNHDEYLELLESKAVRSPKTGTILDYISKEQELELRKQKVIVLKDYDSTPTHIKEHMNFVSKVFHEICEKNKSDELLEFLQTNELGKKALLSTNWYEKYNYTYSIIS